jgi:hypothetical protein
MDVSWWFYPKIKSFQSAAQRKAGISSASAESPASDACEYALLETRLGFPLSEIKDIALRSLRSSWLGKEKKRASSRNTSLTQAGTEQPNKGMQPK